MSRWLGLLGLPLAAGALMFALRLGGGRDVSVTDVRCEEGVWSAEVLEGVARSRLEAWVDGAPATLRWRGARVEVPLADRVGRQFVKLGVVHRGGVERSLTSACTTGPMRSGWIERALVLRVAPEVLDRDLVPDPDPDPDADPDPDPDPDQDPDPDPSTDLASVLSRLLVARAPTGGELGALREAPVDIVPGEGSAFELVVHLRFARGSIRVKAPLQWETDGHQVSLVRTGPVQVAPDARLRAHAEARGEEIGAERGAEMGAEVGAVGGALGEWVAQLGREENLERRQERAGAVSGVLRGLGSVVGEAIGRREGRRRGPEELRRRVRSRLTGTIDTYLDTLSEVMVVPEHVAFEEHGLAFGVRLAGPPSFDAEGGLRIALDLLPEGPHVADQTLAHAPGEPTGEGTFAWVHPSLLAAFARQYVSGGHLEGKLEERLVGSEDRRLRRLRITDVHLRDVVIESAPEDGMLSGVLTPRLTREGGDPVELEARVEVRAAFVDGALEVQPAVRAIGVRCEVDEGDDRDPSAPPVYEACFSDVLSLMPDLPERISRRIPPLRVLEGPLRLLREGELLRGPIALAIEPNALELHDGLTLRFTPTLRAP